MRILALCLLLVAGLVPAARSQDNVLILLADDLGTDLLASYAESTQTAPTPVLDSLASQGILFRNAYVYTLCSPTRAALQTGRYGFRTGVGYLIDDTSFALQPSEVTLPEMLDRGTGGAYRHAAIGKWHLGNDSVGGLLSPNVAGYGHFAGSLFSVFNYFNWPRVVDGVAGTSTTYSTTAIVDDALSWLATVQEPWLLYVSFHAPHSPWHAPPPSLHQYTLPSQQPMHNDDHVPYLHAMVEAMDTEIGRLLAGIDLNKTTVIFLGDNGSVGSLAGPPFDQHHGKFTPYDGGLRVPLLVRSPHVVQPGREVTALVSITDVFATLAELAGVDLTQIALPRLDSVSFAPYLSNPDQPPVRSFAYSELFQPNGLGAQTTWQRSYRNKTFQLIRRNAAPDELYDLTVDPHEQHPLPLGALTPFQQGNYDRLLKGMQRLLQGP